MIVAAVVGLAFALLVLRRLRRKSKADKRGESASRPDHVSIVQPEPGTGPARSRRWSGSLGLPGTRPGGLVSYHLRHVFWTVMARLFNRGSRLRDVLAHTGIVVFVGPNGSGKSLLAVEEILGLVGGAWTCTDLDHHHNRPVRHHVTACPDCVAWSDLPRSVASRAGAGAPRDHFCPDGLALLDGHGSGVYLGYSTLPLLDPETGTLHPFYRPLTHARQLPHIEHAVVFWDEVAGVADADQSSSMPSALKRWCQQLRKRDVFLRVTSPAYDRCALPVRQIAQVVVDCRSFYPVRGGESRRWMSYLGMLYVAYDAFSFGSFDKNSGDRLTPLARLYYWRMSNLGMRAYNTTQQVHALVEVDESGACVVCNGTRSRARCGCDPDVHDIHPDELIVIDIEGARGGRVKRGVRRSESAGSGGVPPGVPHPTGPPDPALPASHEVFEPVR